MQYRHFQKPTVGTAGEIRAFGRRQGFVEAEPDPVSAARLAKALALGVGVGALSTLALPHLLSIVSRLPF